MFRYNKWAFKFDNFCEFQKVISDSPLQIWVTWVTCYKKPFLQQVLFAASNEWSLQQVTSDFYNG